MLTSPLKFPLTWHWYAMIPAGTLYYLVLFDDHQEWFRYRDDVWTLTNQHLSFFNPKGIVAAASVELDDIIDVQLWMFWSLHVRLSNGKSATISYVPNRAAIRDEILLARDTPNGATS